MNCTENTIIFWLRNCRELLEWQNKYQFHGDHKVKPYRSTSENNKSQLPLEPQKACNNTAVMSLYSCILIHVYCSPTG